MESGSRQTIPGRLKLECEDFVVEEIPLYDLSDAGQHLFLHLEKTGLSTQEAIRRLAKAWDLKARDIGYAGLKDRWARTRQWLSVPYRAELEQRAAPEGLTLLARRRHGNKLKPGQLAGNRFQLRIREVQASDLPELKRRWQELLERGAGNRFGSQRFGLDGLNPELGRALLRRQYGPFLELLLSRPRQAKEQARVQEAREQVRSRQYELAVKSFPPSYSAERKALFSLVDHPGDEARAVRAIPRKQRLFYVSALQSECFNSYLRKRLSAPEAVFEGEVVSLVKNGASFVVESVERERERLESGELELSGPLFGPRLLRPKEGSRPFGWEQECLKASGLELEQFSDKSLGLRGLRRNLCVRVRRPSFAYNAGDEVLELGFELARGCYATTIYEQLFGA